MAGEFFAEHVRGRAMEVVAWAGVAGAAALVSHHGHTLILGDRAGTIDVERFRRSAFTVARARTPQIFCFDGDSVHVLELAPGWRFCILADRAALVQPMVERLVRAGHVLAIALRVSASGRAPSGAPANAYAHLPTRRG